MLDRFLADLPAGLGAKGRRDEPLSAHTTPRIGGPADLWLPVGTLAELVAAVAAARQHQLPVFILGGGANLLITEAGIRGLVIENRADRVDFPPVREEAIEAEDAPPAERVTLTAESGVVIPSLVRRCAARGLSGLEWAVGVPGTIGGAVVNNAGAYDGDISRCLRPAELLSPAGERVWQPVDWFGYGYRASRLKQPEAGTSWIVLRAEFWLTRTPVAEVQARLKAFNERRKASQPPGATMGSMFKNPPDDYAGRLIDAAGLKGYRLGQAQISPVHANFFQNLGGATATEMIALIQMAQKTVRDKFGIELELEIEMVGDW